METFDNYPEKAVENAKKALRWKKEYPDDVKGAGTAVGWTRANQLAKREPLTIDTVKRMAQFNRHRDNSKIKDEYSGTPWKDNGYLMWLAWGGTEGIDWAIRVSEKSQENKKESIKIKFNIFKESMGLLDDKGSLWKVTIIESGKSQNDVIYPAQVLKESINIFDGVKVYAHKYGDILDHRPQGMDDPSRFFLNFVGYIKDVQYEGDDSAGKLVGTFHCESEPVRKILLRLWNNDKSYMPGFSIDADGESFTKGNKKEVTRFIKANSLDMVSNPSAGGKFERLVASIQNNNSKGEKMNILDVLLQKVKDGKLIVEGLEGKSDEEIKAILAQEFGIETEVESKESKKEGTVLDKAKDGMSKEEMAKMIESILEGKGYKMKESDGTVQKEENVAVKESDKEVEGVKESVSSLKRELDMQRTAITLDKLLMNESAMPEIAKSRIRSAFAGKIATEETMKESIKSEKAYLDTFRESTPNFSAFSMGDAPADKLSKALDMMVDPDLQTSSDYKGIEPFFGIQHAFLKFVGKSNIHEARKEGVNLKESTTASFPIMLGDSMNKRAVKEYKLMKAREIWTKFVSEESFNNLNAQQLFRTGGFGELSTVAEAGTYPTLTDPSEDNPTYTPIKKGGVFVLTEEMLIDDDTRSIQKFPRELARSANYTLTKFVMDLLTGRGGSDLLNTATIYDSQVLYHETHHNLNTSALSISAFETAYAKMGNQEQADSGNPLGLAGKYLITANELRKTAWDITKNELVQANANGGSIQNAQSRYAVEPLQIPASYFGGVSDCWFLIADPMDIEGLVIGYHNNKREPEVLLQDSPTVATVFTNDQIKYRVKFRYGGAIADYRAFQGYLGSSGNT